MKVGSPEWRKFLHEKLDMPYRFMDYLVVGFHFKFEEADNKNDIDFFNHHSKKHLEFMDYHSTHTYPTFEWKNWNAWRNKKLREERRLWEMEQERKNREEWQKEWRS